jgi:cytochrome d ubiquinol oxidase subunit I
VGAVFNPATMRMEIENFFDVVFNPVAQAKFVHTVSAGYVTAAVFVVGVSAWYLLKGVHIPLARRSIVVASSFGLASALSVVVLGDESGYSASHNQKMKLAAMEGMWETEAAPAAFTLVGWPDQESRETHYAIKVPYVMGLIATRSLTRDIPGIEQLVEEARDRIEHGIIAYDALMHIRASRDAVDPGLKAAFETHGRDLGYALLLKRYVDDPRQATPETIDKAAWDTVPQVAPLFWAFRIMVGLGFFFIGLMAFFFWRASFRGTTFSRPALWLAVIAIPTPWIAAEMGWFVAEFGRQPWSVEGILPTAVAVSHLSMTSVALTLAGFIAFYSVLFVIEMSLMLKYIRKGPYLDDAYVAAWDADRRAPRPSPSAVPAE